VQANPGGLHAADPFRGGLRLDLSYCDPDEVSAREIQAVLEYVDDGSLHRRLDGTPWPATRVAMLVLSLEGGMPRRTGWASSTDNRLHDFINAICNF
jgi:hypothetical protein